MNKRFFVRNTITGLYFDGTSFASQSPTRSFDTVEVAFLRAAWANVEALPAPAFDPEHGATQCKK